MTLEDAIKRLEKSDVVCIPHQDLLTWLMELKGYREQAAASLDVANLVLDSLTDMNKYMR